jgi:hypothetical protein
MQINIVGSPSPSEFSYESIVGREAGVAREEAMCSLPMQITTRQFPVLVVTIPILASLTTGVSAQSAVWVVDARSGAGSHTKSLTEAARFSRTGDVILVRPGTYKSIKLLDKALTILQDGPVGSVVVGSTADAVTIEKAPTGIATSSDRTQRSSSSPGLLCTRNTRFCRIVFVSISCTAPALRTAR